MTQENTNIRFLYNNTAVIYGERILFVPDFLYFFFFSTFALFYIYPDDLLDL